MIQISNIQEQLANTLCKIHHERVRAYRKHNNNFSFSFYNYGEIIPHFEPPERLMNEDISDLGGGYETRRSWEQVRGGESARLDA